MPSVLKDTKQKWGHYEAIKKENPAKWVFLFLSAPSLKKRHSDKIPIRNLKKPYSCEIKMLIEIDF